MRESNTCMLTAMQMFQQVTAYLQLLVAHCWQSTQIERNIWGLRVEICGKHVGPGRHVETHGQALENTKCTCLNNRNNSRSLTTLEAARTDKSARTWHREAELSHCTEEPFQTPVQKGISITGEPQFYSSIHMGLELNYLVITKTRIAKVYCYIWSCLRCIFQLQTHYLMLILTRL